MTSLFTGMAQDSVSGQKPFKYKRAWKKTEKYLKKKEYGQARVKVEEIIQQAKAEENALQVVRALRAYDNIHEKTAAGQPEALIKKYEKELVGAPFPARELLMVELARKYQDFYDMQIGELVNLPDIKDSGYSKDIHNWTARMLLDTIISLHKGALFQSSRLVAVPFSKYQPYIDPAAGMDLAEPSLFDYIAYKALEFFTKPDYSFLANVREFYFDDSRGLLPYKEFIKAGYTAPDRESMLYQAVSLYQLLMEIHRNDVMHNQISLDLDRVDFIYTITFNKDRDNLYVNALYNIELKYVDEPVSTNIGYKIAKFWYDQGENQKALVKCYEILFRFPEAKKLESVEKCLGLKSLIMEPHLKLLNEKFIPADHFVAGIEFKNANKVILQILQPKKAKVIKKLEKKKDRWKKVKLLKRQREVFKRTYKLPRTPDYKSKFLEIPLPPQSLGPYYLLVSDTRKIKKKKSKVAFSAFHVTDLSLVVKKDPDDSRQLLVMHRQEGKPVENAGIRLKFHKPKGDKVTYVKDFTTNRHGKVHLLRSLLEENQKVEVEAIYVEGDTVSLNETVFYNYNYRKQYDHETTGRYKTTFFTDRAIYRPGQTVQFKGILVHEQLQNRKFAVVKDTVTFVRLYDNNNRLVDSVIVRTNHFGSFSGTFTIPEAVLTGSFYIKNESGYSYFKVEEYKRPAFEISFDEIKEAYAYGDTLTLSGIANAYAGYPISNARVQYKITRNTWYVYDRTHYSDITGWMSFREEFITSGSLTTKNNGTFNITAPFYPDARIAYNPQQTSSYKIEVEITDNAGENVTATKHVLAGYQAISASIAAPAYANIADSILNIDVAVTNQQGRKVGADVSIEIFRLEQPALTVRKRPSAWPAPDTFLIDKETFKKLLPHYPYTDEDEPEKWPVDQRIYRAFFNAGHSPTISFKRLRSLDPGKYKVELTTTDKHGETVKATAFFTAFDEEDSAPCLKVPLYMIPVKQLYEVGDTAEVLLGSAYDPGWILLETEHKGRITESRWISIKNRQYKFSFPVTEDMKGGFTLHANMVRHNDHSSERNFMDVSWSKELKIEVANFRKVMDAGEKTEWQITIHPPDSNVAASEMVATLYDASLDSYMPHHWPSITFPKFYSETYFSSYFNFNSDHTLLSGLEKPRKSGKKLKKEYDFAPATMDTRVSSKEAMQESADQAVVTPQATPGTRPKPPILQETGLGRITPRTDFSETAFFYPHLLTDENGKVKISFKIPEALTRWKLMALAHNKSLQNAYLEKELITQRKLMVEPNTPRFLRAGDIIDFTASVINSTDSLMIGQAELTILDVDSLKPINRLFGLTDQVQSFVTSKKRPGILKWKLKVPENVPAFTYKIVATSGNFSDGEQRAVPVLPKEILLTESLPITIPGDTTKEVAFDPLLRSGRSSSIRHQKLLLEINTRPVWSVITALPYLAEYPYDGAEQIFHRYYAHVLANHIALARPEFKDIFSKLKQEGGLQSGLEKYPELRSVLLEETPWLADAQNETKRMQQIASLFEENTIKIQTQRTFNRLKELQTAGGGWPWFPGMPKEDIFITQHIVAGFGHLQKLGVIDIKKQSYEAGIIVKAIDFMDNFSPEEPKPGVQKDPLPYPDIQYLYARSFFKELSKNDWSNKKLSAIKKAARQHWQKKTLMAQAMIALALHRYDNDKTAREILDSLKSKVLVSEELGMYWNENNGGAFWYEAAIETQSLLIEAFDEIAIDSVAVGQMQLWLSRHKQTNNWGSTKATANACYAFLLRGSQQLVPAKITVKAAGQPVEMDTTFTGYYSKTWPGKTVRPELGKLEFQSSGNTSAFGALHWQYLEDMDKVSHSTNKGLSIEKMLFIEKKNYDGTEYLPVKPGTVLKKGDLIKVRFRIITDRDMEYIHIKDLRAGALEPVHQLSSYHYQAGLGFYESIKDASVNLFISKLPHGSYEIEYPLKVSQDGLFTNGIATIQCMYAPEFNAQTPSMKIRVGE